VAARVVSLTASASFSTLLQYARASAGRLA
jgi:hypothetical protein